MSDKYISCSCGKCYLCNLVKRIVSERAKAEKFFLNIRVLILILNQRLQKF